MAGPKMHAEARRDESGAIGGTGLGIASFRWYFSKELNQCAGKGSRMDSNLRRHPRNDVVAWMCTIPQVNKVTAWMIPAEIDRAGGPSERPASAN